MYPRDVSIEKQIYLGETKKMEYNFTKHLI